MSRTTYHQVLDSHAPNVAELPSDVLTEILLRLPAERLVQFKRVCKCWYRLIDNEEFIRWHLERHSRSGTMIDLAFNEYSRGASISKIKFLSFDFEDREPKTRCIEVCLYDCLIKALPDVGVRVHTHFCTGLYVKHSCDGLLLIQVDNWFGEVSRLLVCNPTTKSHELLPPLSKFELSRSKCMIVHDTSVQRYKIIAIGTAETIGCFIFELTRRGEDREWEEVHTDIPSSEHNITYVILHAVSTGKKVHWLMGEMLLSLDLPTKSLRLAKILNHTPKSTRWGHNRVFSDRVMCKVRWYDRLSPNFELWVLEDFDNPMWRKHHVVTNVLTGYNTRFQDHLEGIYVEEAGKLIMNFASHGFMYDMSSQEWMKIEYCREGTAPYRPGYCRHFSSLVRCG